MAHIIINNNEEKLFKNLSPQFPENTTVVVCSADDEQPLRRWRVGAKGGWTLDADFVEQRRPFAKGEEEEFVSKLTKTKIVDFFLTKGDDVAQREWEACSNKEYELMKYVRHSGIIWWDDETRIGCFKFWIRKDAKVRSALSEMNLVLKRLKKHFPQVKEYTFGITEESLSQFGIYEVVVDLEQEKAKLTKTTYGRTEDISDWVSYQETIELIKRNHPYRD